MRRIREMYFENIVQQCCFDMYNNEGCSNAEYLYDTNSNYETVVFNDPLASTKFSITIDLAIKKLNYAQLYHLPVMKHNKGLHRQLFIKIGSNLSVTS